MGEFRDYLRQHPWQRRLMSFLLAGLLGAIAALVVWPILRDRQMINDLGSPDRARREKAVAAMVSAARLRPELVTLMQEKLPTAGDGVFLGIIEALGRLNKFDSAAQPPLISDRYHQLALAAAGDSPNTRQLRMLHLNYLVRAGRDNRFIRTAMDLAAKDTAPQVREYACILAAQFGDDAMLIRLIGDEFLDVRIAAMLDAGLAGRQACVELIAARLGKTICDEEYSAAAYALAMLAPARAVEPINAGLARALENRRAGLRDLLLLAAPLAGKETAPAVMKCLEQYWPQQVDLADWLPPRRAVRAGAPPVMALITAGKMKLPQALPYVQSAIADVTNFRLAVGPGDTLAAAAFAAGEIGDAATASQLAAAMHQLWSPRYSLAMFAASEAMGTLSRKLPAGSASQPGQFTSQSDVLKLLQEAAEYAETPIPAAAAAASLAERQAEGYVEAVQTAASSADLLAGDYLAWRLGHKYRRPLGSRMTLPPEAIINDLLGRGLHSIEGRSAGIMLAGYAGRGGAFRPQITKEMEDRLAAARDPLLIGSCKCALLVLGRKDMQPDVLALVRTDKFPRQRALMALAQAGVAEGFDLVLADDEFRPGQLDVYLSDRLMYPVYRTLIPKLPDLDPAAGEPARTRQLKLVRDYYLIHRKEILSQLEK